MTASLDLTELLEDQRELDLDIMAHHPDTGYRETFNRRSLALLVELGEFANETRCFKYWSLKGPSPKERVLDEAADALHFFLSLGLAMGLKELKIVLKYPKIDGKTALSDLFLRVYEEVSSFAKTRSEKTYHAALSDFLSLVEALGYSLEDLQLAYLAKRDVNFQRQRSAY